LENDYLELNNIALPASSFNISARAPLHSYKGSDSTFEDDNFLPEKKVLNNERKRKFEDLVKQDQKPSKILKLWSLLKYPFQKKTCTSLSEDKSNTPIEIIVEKENTIEPESTVCENNSDNAKPEEKNTQNSFEANDKIKDSCNIM